MSAFSQDFRHALRVLAKSPAFTAAAAATLALGIGANTAIFSVVRAVLLKPLPYAEPERLVGIWDRQPEVEYAPDTALDLGHWERENRSPERIIAARVSPGFFQLLGVAPATGRLFPADAAAVDPHEVVVSYGLWHRLF